MPVGKTPPEKDAISYCMQIFLPPPPIIALDSEFYLSEERSSDSQKLISK